MDTSSFTELFKRSFGEALEGMSQNIPFAPIMNIKPHEFSGEGKDSITDWVDQFEHTTLNLSDDQKKKILICAFTRSARAWFKDDLEPWH